MAEILFNRAKDFSFKEESNKNIWNISFFNIEKVQVSESVYHTTEIIKTTVKSDANGNFDVNNIPKIIIRFPENEKQIVSFMGISFAVDYSWEHGRPSDLVWAANVDVKFYDVEYDLNMSEIKRTLVKQRGIRPEHVYDGETEDVLKTRKYHLSKEETAYMYGCDARHINEIVIEFVSTRNTKSEAIFNDLFFRFLVPLEENFAVDKIEQIKSINIKEQIDILSADIPLNSCDCTIISKKPIYLQKNVEFDVEQNGAYLGRFYVVQFNKIGENIYTISSNSITGKLGDKTYSDFPLLKIREFVDTIIESDELDGGVFLEGANQLVVYKQNQDPYYLNGFFGNDTYRKLLCQIGWATRTIIDDSRKSYISLVNIPNNISSIISNKNNCQRIIGNATISTEGEIYSAEYILPRYQYNHLDGFAAKGTNQVELISARGDYSETTRYYFDNAPVQAESVAVYNDDGSYIRDLNIVKNRLNYIDFKDDEKAGIINIKIWGFECGKNSQSHIVFNKYADDAQLNNIKYDKYTIYPLETDMSADLVPKKIWVSNKLEDIKNVLESEGFINAKIVMENERVGELIMIDTYLYGLCQGIITSIEYSPSVQMIANIKVKIFNTNLAPIKNQSGVNIRNKDGSLIGVRIN